MKYNLNKYPYSPRKMRLIANIIINMNVFKALYILKNIKKHASIPIANFLRSAILNWQLTNKPVDNLYIKVIQVNSSRVLKRLRPASQGKGHIIRKKFSNISIILDNKL